MDVSQGYGRGAKKGDIQIPLVLAPYDYCGGVGAAVAGWPFERFSTLAHGSPGAPPMELDEDPEPNPGKPDPDLDFTITPPLEPRDGGPKVSPPLLPEGTESAGDDVPETVETVGDSGG